MVKKYIKEARDLKNFLLKDKNFILKIKSTIKIVKDCLKKGHKILIAGNGGSAADAQHFAAELVGRYKKERPAYPAVALTVDTSIITALANDYSFDSIFSRQIEALGQKGDVFLGISTSGNSANILEAIRAAKKRGLKSICLLGKDGGRAVKEADLSIIVPSQNTPRIQEIHIMLLHIIAEEIERQIS